MCNQSIIWRTSFHIIYNKWKLLQCGLRMGHLPSFFVPCLRGAFGRSSVAAPGAGERSCWAQFHLTDALLCTGHFKTPLSSIKHFFFSIFSPTKHPPHPLPRWWKMHTFKFRDRALSINIYCVRQFWIPKIIGKTVPWMHRLLLTFAVAVPFKLL